MKVPAHAVSSLGLTALAVVLVVPAARAEGIGPCVREANHAYRNCKRDCREDYQLATDLCINRDHECVEDCRGDRETCRQPHVDALRAAVDECDESLEAAKATCRSLHADGTPERDSCIDQAQVVAFGCRDAARETVRPALKACRLAFRACVQTNCPPLDPPDPASVRACKRDARDNKRACYLDCREARELAKDTCLDRDHACVEQCRAERALCRAPFVAIRDTAIDQCNATRDTALQNCRNLYAPDTPGREACIDQAQLEAFQCRDAAREGVADDLAACRAAFRACALACPPPGGSPSGAFLDGEQRAGQILF